jgi:nucleoside-diphosphate kinase
MRLAGRIKVASAHSTARTTMSSSHAQTFAMIKSGAMARKSQFDITRAIRSVGLNIVRERHIAKLPTETAEALYAEHQGKPFFPGLIDSVTGDAGVYAMLLEGPNAVAAWRTLMGPTDPTKAPKGTIRGDFGGEALPDNAVHGSDSQESAKREADLFFPAM